MGSLVNADNVTMNLIISLLSGFITFCFDYSPGLLNMTAAKVNLKEGKEMPLGSFRAVIIFFQAYLAILFARVIDIRPDIVILLREVGFVYLSFNVLFLF
jgi:hypothetical protein